MASPLDSLATYIATDLAVGALGTVVFEDSLPDSSDGSLDTCVAVISTAGAPPALTTGDDTDYPGFLILSRSLSADTALANLQTIFHGIHGKTETTIHGTYFKLIYAISSSPMGLGRDERQRFMFSQAFRALVRGVSR